MTFQRIGSFVYGITGKKVFLGRVLRVHSGLPGITGPDADYCTLIRLKGPINKVLSSSMLPRSDLSVQVNHPFRTRMVGLFITIYLSISYNFANYTSLKKNTYPPPPNYPGIAAVASKIGRVLTRPLPFTPIPRRVTLQNVRSFSSLGCPKLPSLSHRLPQPSLPTPCKSYGNALVLRSQNQQL
jgi:hypothetical protein